MRQPHDFLPLAALSGVLSHLGCDHSGWEELQACPTQSVPGVARIGPMTIMRIELNPFQLIVHVAA